MYHSMCSADTLQTKCSAQFLDCTSGELWQALCPIGTVYSLAESHILWNARRRNISAMFLKHEGVNSRVLVKSSGHTLGFDCLRISYVECALQRTNTENSKQIFPEKELRGHSLIFHIHVYVSDLSIPTIDLPILLQEICGPILEIWKCIYCKSLTDTWMRKLGLRPRNSQKRNTKMEFSLQDEIKLQYVGWFTVVNFLPDEDCGVHVLELRQADRYRLTWCRLSLWVSGWWNMDMRALAQGGTSLSLGNSHG